MSDKKIVLQFTLITFCIAYCVSGVLIALGQFGYRVYGFVNSLDQFVMNMPFSIYILSPAIASYIVLKYNNQVANIGEWLKTVFFIKDKNFLYLISFIGIVLYFDVYVITSNSTISSPIYMFFLSLPGNFIIGGLEEVGWMYVLQPRLDKKYGYVISSLLIGLIWVLWHIPLFFIPGTNHCDGMINFWMFNVQVISISFFRGAIYKIAGNGYIFTFILFHTMFNAASSLFKIITTTWIATISANTALILFSIIIVVIHARFRNNHS